MDLSTFFLLGCLVFLFLVLFWLFYSNSDRPFHFYGESSGWSKFNDEHVGILGKSQTLSRIPLRSCDKESGQLAYSSPLDDFIKMGYGITEENEEKRQYLVPTDEIQQQLEVVPRADVHLTPSHETVEVALPPPPSSLRRAMSTDSLDSTTSSLIDTSPDMPAAHLVITYHEPSQMLSVQVERVTDACSDLGHVWLLFFLLPHPKPLWRTEARMTPASVITYNCIFQQCVKKTDLHKIALLVQMYSSRNQAASITGQCRLRLKDINIGTADKDVPVVLSLQPSRSRLSVDEVAREKLGDILFLVSFARETLTVVVSKIRGIDLKHTSVFVRLYLVLPMGKCVKKKTSERVLEEGDADIAESMFFPITSRTIQARLNKPYETCKNGRSM